MMHHSRRGFSLMEVMLSTSILLGSSIALIELATIGRKQANSAYDLNTAQLLCQAKLDEIVAGVISAKSVEEEELEENPEWMYSVEVLPFHVRPLMAVKVSVFQESKEGRRPTRFTLVRWLPDHSLNSSNNSPTALENESLPSPPRPNLRREGNL
jgi:Tfp pilus assembly protein PilV